MDPFLNISPCDYFKIFLEKIMSGQVPPSEEMDQVDEDEGLDDDIEESDVDLDDTEVVEPDNDPPVRKRSNGNLPTAQVSKSKALAAISDGNLEEAINHLANALLVNPKSAILYEMRANVFIKMKKPNAAIRDAIDALKINPNSAKGRKALGMARALLQVLEDPEAAAFVKDGEVIKIYSITQLKSKLTAASEASQLTVVYFSGTWNGSLYREFDSIVSSLAQKYPKVVFLDLDIDEFYDADALPIVSSIPSFAFVKNCKEVDQNIRGTQNDLEQKIAKHCA